MWIRTGDVEAQDWLLDNAFTTAPRRHRSSSEQVFLQSISEFYDAVQQGMVEEATDQCNVVPVAEIPQLPADPVG